MATPLYVARASEAMTSEVGGASGRGMGEGTMAGSADPPLWAGLAPPTFCSENAFFLVDHLHHTYDPAKAG